MGSSVTTRPVAEAAPTDTLPAKDYTIIAPSPQHADIQVYTSGNSPGAAPAHRSVRTVDVLPYAEYVASLPRKRMSAGILLHDDAGRVVLVEPSYKTTWEVPGGVVEAGEAPWHAASRELTEELGLVRERMRLLVVDHLPARDDGMPEGVAWIFDGGHVREQDLTTFDLDAAEITSAGLYRPEEVRDRTTLRLARRLVIALAAARQGTGPVLCDDGVPTSRRP